MIYYLLTALVQTITGCTMSIQNKSSVFREDAARNNVTFCLHDP